MLELDFREPHECELAFVGLLPELSGNGHRPLASRRSGAACLARRRATVFTSIPARSITRRRSAPIAARGSCRSNAVERFPTRGCSAFCRLDCAPQIPVVGTVASRLSVAGKLNDRFTSRVTEITRARSCRTITRINAEQNGSEIPTDA